jgi:hypothetical protein
MNRRGIDLLTTNPSLALAKYMIHQNDTASVSDGGHFNMDAANLNGDSIGNSTGNILIGPSNLIIGGATGMTGRPRFAKFYISSFM